MIESVDRVETMWFESVVELPRKATRTTLAVLKDAVNLSICSISLETVTIGRRTFKWVIMLDEVAASGMLLL